MRKLLQRPFWWPQNRFTRLNSRNSEWANCVYLSQSAVATVSAMRSNRDEPDLFELKLRADPVERPSDYIEHLKSQRRSLRLNGPACHIVLSPEFYSLTMLEKPLVENEEVASAVRWALQEKIEVDLNDALIDTFDLPRAASRESDRPVLFAVTASREVVDQHLTRLSAASFEGTSMGISELAYLRIMATVFPEPDQSIGLVRLTSSAGTINISRASELYLCRSISGVPGRYSDATWNDFKDKLLVQVQRSIDFYESTMGQASCDAIIVATTDGWQRAVCQYLDEMLPMPILSLERVLAEHFKIELHNPDSETIDWQNLNGDQSNAISAALPAIGGVIAQIVQGSPETRRSKVGI